jgi:multidrug efflux pump subunit AcrA (membrane-fusion protein)
LSVRVDAADASLQGTIGEIAPQVDAAARSVLVKVDLPADAPSLHAGMFARVSVPRPEVEALSVPADAVSSRGSLDRVFVVAGGVARLRLVTTGARYGQPEDGQPENGPREVILSGLEAGEEVIVDPPSTLRDRDAVEVVR